MGPPGPVFTRLTDEYETPDKSRIIQSKPFISPTVNSFKFRDEYMIPAKYGLLECQNLENAMLMADGEDMSGICRYPV
jgi:serine/arginine repetitive matrix protein 2